MIDAELKEQRALAVGLRDYSRSKRLEAKEFDRQEVTNKSP